MIKTNKTEEQLYNRILINLGAAILAYIFLYVIYNIYYLTPAFGAAVDFFALAVIGYVLSAIKAVRINVKNYAHMFLGFGIAMLFTQMSKIFGTVMGIDRFISLMDKSKFFRLAMNSQKEVIVLCWLGVIYLVGMFIYNSILISKVRRNNKANKKLKK